MLRSTFVTYEVWDWKGKKEYLNVKALSAPVCLLGFSPFNVMSGRRQNENKEERRATASFSNVDGKERGADVPGLFACWLKKIDLRGNPAIVKLESGHLFV